MAFQIETIKYFWRNVYDVLPLSLKAAISRVVLSQTFKTLTKFIERNAKIYSNTVRFIIEYIFIRYSFYVIDVDTLFYKIGQS